MAEYNLGLYAHIQHCMLNPPITVEELKITPFLQACEKVLLVRCISKITNGNILEMGFEDETGVILGLAYDDRAIMMTLVIQIGSWYKIQNFKVRKENKDVIEHVNKLMIVFEATDKMIKDETKIGRTSPKLKTIRDIYAMEMGCLVGNTPENCHGNVKPALVVKTKDVNAVNPEESKDGEGQVFNLTDDFGMNIPMTVLDLKPWMTNAFENARKALVKTQNETIIRRAVISTFEGRKCLKFKWFSEVQSTEET